VAERLSPARPCQAVVLEEIRAAQASGFPRPRVRPSGGLCPTIAPAVLRCDAAVPGDPGQRGFTVVEVLIALLVLIIGMAGILSMQITSVQATAFSRHATEASVLGEDKMEQLRTMPTTALVGGNDQVDARGVIDAQGLYAREWTVEPLSSQLAITVTVSWMEEGGGDPHEIILTTMRAP
jgi:type IV pilus assembly protein PilV